MSRPVCGVVFEGGWSHRPGPALPLVPRGLETGRVSNRRPTVSDHRAAIVSVGGGCYFYSMSIYQQLGVRPIINASGMVTRLGGALMPEQVLAAFDQAARETVSLEQLQACASVRIAEATGTEAGLVTSGAAAALTLGTAAILTGHDFGRMERLPDCSGFPAEFLIAREQRSGYDHAVRAAGARLTEVGFNELVAGAGVRRTEAWEYEAAVTPQTAGIIYVQAADSRPALDEVVAVARRHELPLLVDAAGEVPPRSMLQDIAATGADLVAYSGGKGIRGPQSTGILCGRRELISAAALQMLDMDDHPELWEPPEELIDRSQLNGLPRHGIGRGYKVSKEEIVALLTALELFVSGAWETQRADSCRWLQTIADQLTEAGLVCQNTEPTSAEQWPQLEVEVEPARWGRSAMEVCRELRLGTPPVYVGHAGLHRGVLIINPVCLTETSLPVLVQRLLETAIRE